MEIVFLIGRIFYGLTLAFMASNHFMNLKMMSGYAQSKKVPMPTVAVLGSGVILLLGALSILTGFQATIGALLVVVFLLPVAFLMHNFWAVPGEMQAVEMSQFLKNVALAGAALMFLAIPQPWPLSLGG